VPLKQGLDLQGGIHLALEVDESKGAVADRAGALDRALRVIRTVETEAQMSALASPVLDAVSELPWVEPRVLLAQAPVLLVPRVLEPEVCEQLMEVWRTCGKHVRRLGDHRLGRQQLTAEARKPLHRRGMKAV